MSGSRIALITIRATNAVAMQVPPALINDIFITHLHGDHYADLPYMYPFTAWSGRWSPLRVYGPSGATPELGTKHMVKHMREMMRWHEENFNACPVGDGMEIDVTEFDWKDENGVWAIERLMSVYLRTDLADEVKWRAGRATIPLHWVERAPSDALMSTSIESNRNSP